MGGPCNADGQPVGCTDNLQHGKKFTFEGKEWPSVEAAFQAMKYQSEDKKEEIRQCGSGIAAARAGQERLPIRPDWDAVRHLVMYRAARIRYQDNDDLAQELLSTGNKSLTHGDGNPFWAKWNALVQTRCREELKPVGEQNNKLLQDLIEQFESQWKSECKRLGVQEQSIPGEKELTQAGIVEAGAPGGYPSNAESPKGDAPKANPRVFLVIAIAEKPVGKIVIELFADVVPKTADNFRALCTGEKGEGKTGKPLHFKGCIVHRVVRDFVIEAGDFTAGNGKGGESIYGPKFDDENFTLKHDSAGILSMSNAGPNTNKCVFSLITKGLLDVSGQQAPGTPWLDGKQVVFGRVIEGMEVVKEIDQYGTQSGKTEDPKTKRPVKIIISDCGLL